MTEFVNEEVVPRAAEIDETGELPTGLIDRMAELELMGIPSPTETKTSKRGVT